MITWTSKKALATLALLATMLPQASAAQKVLVAYYSATGHTALMADEVGKGARSVSGSEVRVLPVDSVSTADVKWADALVVGSPVHSANISAPVVKFLSSMPFDGSMRNKVGAAFVTAGGMSAGEEEVQLSILRAMLVYNMIVVGGPSWTQAFGASAVTGEAPFLDTASVASVDSIFLTKGFNLGARVAQMAKLLASRSGG
ncbi:MAG: flavodoxin family protein [Gemmatimonadetes bacterium]|nr:flavodoxin family protein [Gemmatimonadota bacterium]